MKLKELTNEEFQAFANNYPISSVFQTPEYAMVMNKQNYDTFYLGMVDDNDNILAASLILVELLGKFQYAYAPRGYLVDYQDENLVKTFSKQIKKFLKKKSVMAIKIAPIIRKSITKNNGTEIIDLPDYDKKFKFLKKIGYYHLGYNRFFEAIKPRFEAVIPLDKNSSIMFQKVRKEFRTKIRMSDRNGVRIYKGSSQNLSFFYKMTKDKYPRDLKYFQDVYEHYSKRNMVDIYFALLDTKAYLISVQKQLQAQNIRCSKVTEEIFKRQGNANNTLISRKISEDNKLAGLKNQLVSATNLLHRNPDGIILACAMVIRYKNEAYLLMDGYEPTYKKMNAKHLLIWKLMEKYGNEGYELFNLGGIVDPKDPEKYKGLNDFRLGFGSNIVEYIGDLELITSRPLYMTYRNTAPLRNMMKK